LAATAFPRFLPVAADARQQTSRFLGGHTFSGHTESKNPVELPACPYEFDGRSKCEGDVMGQTAHHYLIFETAGGFCGIAWNNVGITRFQLPTKSAEAAERTLLRRLPGAERGAPTPEVVEAVAAVKRYFEGEETDFSGFKLDLGGQDPFFEQIYAAARRVGWGRTTTYGTLAKELGAGPEAARDVGQAMAKNPVALIIPCHRVLAAGGKVGGFSAPGGSAAKIRMLALEGIHLEPPAPAQQSFGF
jgi:methylated-DNA-[protein]-cysteine S-methyltransferase